MSNAICPLPSSNLLPQGCTRSSHVFGRRNPPTTPPIVRRGERDRPIAPRKSSGSRAPASAMEPTISQNITRHSMVGRRPGRVSDQYRQIPASSFAPMRLGSREVPHAGGQAIPRRRLPCSETPARTGASRGCVAKSRPLLPSCRYVSVVPLTGDLEFNSSPKEQSVKRITLRKIFRRLGSMTPHAAIRPFWGVSTRGPGRCSIFARPLNIHLGSKRRTLGTLGLRRLLFE